MDDDLWHLADKPTAPEFDRFWTNSGQRSMRDHGALTLGDCFG
jgi:hypothetical protein